MLAKPRRRSKCLKPVLYWDLPIWGSRKHSAGDMVAYTINRQYVEPIYLPFFLSNLAVMCHEYMKTKESIHTLGSKIANRFRTQRSSFFTDHNPLKLTGVSGGRQAPDASQRPENGSVGAGWTTVGWTSQISNGCLSPGDRGYMARVTLQVG